MEWKLDAEREQFNSACGKFRITNEGKKNGSMYVVWTLESWSSAGKGYTDFIRLLKVGTLDECLQFKTGV